MSEQFRIDPEMRGESSPEMTDEERAIRKENLSKALEALTGREDYVECVNAIYYLTNTEEQELAVDVLKYAIQRCIKIIDFVTGREVENPDNQFLPPSIDHEPTNISVPYDFALREYVESSDGLDDISQIANKLIEVCFASGVAKGSYGWSCQFCSVNEIRISTEPERMREFSQKIIDGEYPEINFNFRPERNADQIETDQQYFQQVIGEWRELTRDYHFPRENLNNTIEQIRQKLVEVS